MGDPTDTFREMMLEARIDRAARTEKSLHDLEEKVERSEIRWNEAELRERVATILADTIREAGHTDHEALARAIAPHIIGTVRNEIGNAHPEIIEALSPRLGELIRAAVAKSVEDLQRQIDQAVPVDLWIATLKAKDPARRSGVPGAGSLSDRAWFRPVAGS
jgi:F0F1-type ATP synthase membrane subunit b/b'